MVFACVDELIERSSRGDTRPKRLKSPAMGKWKKN